MKKITSCLVLSSVILLTFGCAKSSSSAEVSNNKNCVPESELMSAGIVGGSRVYESSADDKNVVMLLSAASEKADKVAICTSVALTPRVLLTAAHCVPDDSDASKIIAVTRSTLSCESGVNLTRDQIRVTKVIRHEGYTGTDGSEIENDLALVFLSSALPAKYPTYKLAEPTAVTSASALYFWGFGEIGNDAGGSGMLRKTQVERSDYSIVSSDKKISVNQANGHGICHGDSGGPGLIKVNGELQVLGINSYIYGTKGSTFCNGTSYLTLVDSFKPWIQQKMASRNEKLKN